MLTKDEKDSLISALKKKWETVHKEYQEITHITKVSTIGLKRRLAFALNKLFFRKETKEKELEQLQKDIEKLSKNYIFIDTTADSYY